MSDSTGEVSAEETREERTAMEEVKCEWMVDREVSSAGGRFTAFVVIASTARSR